MTRLRTILLAALVGLLALAPAAPAAKRMRSIFQDDCLLVRLDQDRRCQQADPAAAVREMRELGADTVRITVIDDKTSGSGWDFYDAAVNSVLDEGLDPFISLTARTGATRRPITPRGWSRFVTAAVTRYPRVHLWSLYNEPNLRYFLRSRSPREYRALFVAAQDALRRVPGHRRDIVLLGELAPRATANNNTARGPLFFMREFFCLDSRLRPYAGRAARSRGCRNFRRVTANGFAYHPYTNAAIAPPNFVDRGDGAAIATLGRLTRILDAAARRRRANRMAIWDTEMGFQSNPPDRRAASPQRQAEFINWGDWLQFRNPRVASVSQYNLVDARSRETYNTGLRFNSGRVKPALAAYRLPIYVTRAGRGFARVWAQVRPGRTQTVAIERQSGGRGRFRRVATRRTNPSGYTEVRLRAGTRDRFRLRWQRFTSRVAVVR